MNHLDCRVHTGIGASRTNDGDGRMRDQRQRGLDCRLHGRAMTVALPAEELAAVVFDAQCVTHTSTDFAQDSLRFGLRRRTALGQHPFQHAAGTVEIADVQVGLGQLYAG